MTQRSCDGPTSRPVGLLMDLRIGPNEGPTVRAYALHMALTVGLSTRPGSGPSFKTMRQHDGMGGQSRPRHHFVLCAPSLRVHFTSYVHGGGARAVVGWSKQKVSSRRECTRHQRTTEVDTGAWHMLGYMGCDGARRVAKSLREGVGFSKRSRNLQW